MIMSTRPNRRILFWTDDQPKAHVGKTKTFPRKGVIAVVEHLKRGSVHRTLERPMKCQICGIDLGAVEMTDGEVVWPNKAHHYVTAHKVWSPEHTWLAERLLIGGDVHPPSQSSDTEVVRPARRRRRRPPMEQPQPTPAEDPGFDMEALGASVAADWGAVEVPQTGDPLPGDYVEIDGVRTELAPEEAEEPADPWAMDDAVFDAMATATLTEDRPRREPRREAGPRPARRRRPPTRERPGRRRRRRPGEAPQQSVERGRPQGQPTPNRPAMLDVSAPVGDAVGGEAALPQTTALVVADQGEPMIHPAAYGADDPAANIAAAYPKAGLALARKVVQVAGEVGAHPYDLANLIQFESGKSWSPQAQNPSSKATGLIQFYPRLTKDNIGVTVDYLAGLSAVDQMDWVKTYLDRMRGGQPLDTPHKVAMAVFYPAAIPWSPTQRFPAKVTQANPGIYTPDDYLRLMLRTAKLPTSRTAPHFPYVQEVGLLGQLASWWQGLVGGPPAPVPPPQPQPPVVQHTAVWESDPSLNTRLVAPDGQAFGPGPINPGNYQLEAWVNGGWLPLAQVPVASGRSYRIYLQQGRLKWSEK
jgi:hypothetical protein